MQLCRNSSISKTGCEVIITVLVLIAAPNSAGLARLGVGFCFLIKTNPDLTHNTHHNVIISRLDLGESQASKMSGTEKQLQPNTWPTKQYKITGSIVSLKGFSVIFSQVHCQTPKPDRG